MNLNRLLNRLLGVPCEVEETKDVSFGGCKRVDIIVFAPPDRAFDLTQKIERARRYKGVWKFGRNDLIFAFFYADEDDLLNTNPHSRARVGKSAARAQNGAWGGQTYGNIDFAQQPNYDYFRSLYV